MRLGAIRARVQEARELHSALEEETGSPGADGRVLVSGMLAEQLARELGREAAPGAVLVGDAWAFRDGDVAVHVFAGEPSEADVAHVRSADRDGVPVVLVQLWPQEDWTPPFVLTPFVVECKPGAGFPLDEIAARVVEASGDDPGLPERAPFLRDALERRAVRGAILRAGIVGLLGGRGRAARPLITLEQARLVARLRPLPADAVADRAGAAAAGTVAALEAWGLLLREAARRARAVAPTRVSDALIAAGGTAALAAAARAVRARLSHDDS